MNVSSRFILVVALVTLLMSLIFPLAASAQAGAACAGTVCGLGGQIRAQPEGFLVQPLQISPPWGTKFFQFSPTFPSSFQLITIMSVPFPGAGYPLSLPLVGKGLGAPGQVKPTPFATIMQTSQPATTAAPRALSLAPGAFRYAGQPVLTLPVANVYGSLFALQTNLEFDYPHPGTTKSGAAAVTFSGGAIPTPMANVFSAGGRVGAPIVTYYANATTLGPGSPANNFGAMAMVPTAMAGEAGALNINGLARFTATANQFWGSNGRSGDRN